jgi:adenine-specific DNA-methyltransferase
MLKEVIENNAKVKPNSDFLNELQQHLPQFFDKTGNFNNEKFTTELKENNIAESKDGYRLSFVGKDYARLQTGRASETLIQPDTTHNSEKENADSQNIFITGDNLEALRHLQNAYRNKVKMIYIDPPYNTGKEFVYNDFFEFDEQELKVALGYNDDEIERLKSIQGKSSHSAWLTFMYPRLKLAQKLLTDDGVIFVSIDDNEQANLKLLMDDVFGEGNFVGEFIINRPSEIATENVIQKHEYLICYAKNEMLFKVDSIQKCTISRGTVGNSDQTTPIITFPKGLRCYVKDGTYKETRKIKGSNENIENFDPIIVKDETLVNDVRMQARWRSSNDMRNFFNNDCKPTKAKINGIIEEIYFENDKFNPQIKKSTYEKIPSLYLDNSRGSKNLEDLDMNGLFDNPKDVGLLYNYIKILTKPNDIILDFFAGSATTAHAVMQLNAEDEGNRKFIMVQLDEETNPDSEARKAGYKTIDEISRERIKRAAKKIKSENPMFAENLDLGFKHYRLITSIVETLDKITEFSNEDLFSVDMISEMGGLETILTTWLIDGGNTFDTKIEEIVFPNYTAQYVAESKTLYLINEGFNTEALKEMLNKIGKCELAVSTIVVYPYSFGFEMMRELEIGVKSLDNAPQIIKKY